MSFGCLAFYIRAVEKLGKSWRLFSIPLASNDTVNEDQLRYRLYCLCCRHRGDIVIKGDFSFSFRGHETSNRETFGSSLVLLHVIQKMFRYLITVIEGYFFRFILIFQI